MQKSIRILLVEDELIVCEAIAALLENETGMIVVGEATNIEMARYKAHSLRPDVILLDLRLEGQLGIEVISALLHDNPAVRIVILTGHADAQEVAAAFRAGAVGYVLKTQAVDELVQAVFNAYNGQSSVPPRIAKIMLQTLNPTHKASETLCPLSDAERRVLAYVAGGLENKQIARLLGITQPTVHAHVSRILSKLQVENRTQATLLALKHGLVSLDGQTHHTQLTLGWGIQMN